MLKIPLIHAVLAAVGAIRQETIAYNLKETSEPFHGKHRRGNDNKKAQAHGISKAMRQYARRYGKSVDDIIQMHARHPHSYRAHDRMRRTRAPW